MFNAMDFIHENIDSCLGEIIEKAYERGMADAKVEQKDIPSLQQERITAFRNEMENYKKKLIKAMPDTEIVWLIVFSEIEWQIKKCLQGRNMDE